MISQFQLFVFICYGCYCVASESMLAANRSVFDQGLRTTCGTCDKPSDDVVCQDLQKGSPNCTSRPDGAPCSYEACQQPKGGFLPSDYPLQCQDCNSRCWASTCASNKCQTPTPWVQDANIGACTGKTVGDACKIENNIASMCGLVAPCHPNTLHVVCAPDNIQEGKCLTCFDDTKLAACLGKSEGAACGYQMYKSACHTCRPTTLAAIQDFGDGKCWTKLGKVSCDDAVLKGSTDVPGPFTDDGSSVLQEGGELSASSKARRNRQQGRLSSFLSASMMETGQALNKLTTEESSIDSEWVFQANLQEHMDL